MQQALPSNTSSRLQQTAVTWLTMSVDLGLASILFVAPLFMGGRHPLGRLVFVTLAVTTSLAWSVRQCLVSDGKWRRSTAIWLLLAGAGLLLLQLVPLPPQALATLSPDLGEILPLWQMPEEGQPAMGAWCRVSLTPAVTRGGLAMFLAYGLMFLVTVQRIGHLDDVRRITRWFALATIWMAAFAVMQCFTSNGKFVWIYEHPFRTVRGVQGSFINGNHFCHLLALGIGPLVYCLVASLQQSSKARRRGFAAGGDSGESQSLAPTAWAIGLAVVLFAGLMSLSRGGIVAIAAASLVVSVVYYLTSLVGTRALWSMVALVLVVGVALFIYGHDRVAGELDDFAAMSVDELDKRSARRNLWLANWTSFRGSPWLGRGVGSHREFYKIFMPNRLPVEFTHAESGYVQVASEAGIAGITLLAVGIGLVGYWCGSCFRATKCRQTLAALGAVAAGLTASVVHSLWDFVWYIPATMSWAVLLAGMACRLHQVTFEQRGTTQHDMHLPRAGWIVITILLALVGIWIVRDRVPPALASRHWDNYLKKSQLLAKIHDQSYVGALGEASSDAPSSEQLVQQMTDDLEAFLRHESDYGRAHLRLAATYLRRFHYAQRHGKNPMDLSQIRDAAIASQFPSRAALNEWLDRAIGEHRVYLDKSLWHARRGLQLCPVQGEGYIYLAELCFLEGAPASATSAYVGQALKVRPHDGHVLFMAGKEALLKSDLESAIRYWKQSFHAGASHQRQLASLLAGRLPVAFLLENIQPGLDAWQTLFAEYTRLGQPQELRQLCEYYVALADGESVSRSDPRWVRMWLTMHNIYRELDAHDAANSCIRRAIEIAPYHYVARFAFAYSELQRGNVRDAESHLKWCAQQRPADGRVQALLKRVVRQRVAGRPSSTSPQNASHSTRGY